MLSVRAFVIAALVLVVPFGWNTTAGDACATPASCTPASDVRWERADLRAGEFADVVIAPTDPDVMYVGVEVNAHAFYKSTDGGASWTRVEWPGDHAKVVAVSPTDAEVAYVAMSESVATTDLSFQADVESRYGGRDGDDDVQTILTTGGMAGPAFASFSAFVVAPGDDRVLYAATKGQDGGHGDASARLWKSTDAGASWTMTLPSVPVLNALAVDARDSDRVLAASTDGVHASADGGASFTHVLETHGPVRALATTSADEDRVYAAWSGGIAVSRDAGASWSRVSVPFADAHVHRVRAAASDADVVYVTTEAGVWRSVDAGATWRDASGNLRARNVQALAVHPEDPDIAFVGHSGFWSSVHAPERYRQGLLAHQGLFKTTDGGVTWTRSDAGIEDREFEVVTVNPGRAHEAWVGSPASRGALVTHDGGQSWRNVQTPTLHYPMRVAFHPSDADIVYATSWHTGGAFARSTDGGRSWTATSEDAFHAGVTRGRHLLAENAHGPIHLHGLAVNPANPEVIYAGSVADESNPAGFPLAGAHVFKSTDGGVTWAESDDGFPHDAATSVHAMLVDPEDPRVVYLATSEHEAERAIGVWKSTDAGASWSRASTGLSSMDVHALAFRPENSRHLLAATGDGVYASADGAETWTRVLDAPARDVQFVRDDPLVAFASTTRGVWRTLDGGASWQDVTNGLPLVEGQGIAVDPSGDVVYAAASGVGLYVARLTDIPVLDPPSELGMAPGSGFPPRTDSERDGAQWDEDRGRARDPPTPRERGMPAPAVLSVLAALAFTARTASRRRRSGP